MLYCEEQFSVLANLYGNEIFDEYNGDTVHAKCLISKNDQQAKVQYSVTEFNEPSEKLKANVLEEANRELRLNQLKREEMESLAQHRSIPEDIYSTGYQQQFTETMKLFKFALLISPSMASVERGFSMMNLLISPLRTSLGEKNLDHMICVCLDGPENLSDKTVEKLINTFIATGRRIDLQFIVYFLVYASVVMVISLRSFHHKKKKLLCLLYLDIIHFILNVHFHLLLSFSYSIILFLSDYTKSVEPQIEP